MRANFHILQFANNLKQQHCQDEPVDWNVCLHKITDVCLSENTFVNTKRQLCIILELLGLRRTGDPLRACFLLGVYKHVFACVQTRLCVRFQNSFIGDPHPSVHLGLKTSLFAEQVSFLGSKTSTGPEF